MIEFKTEQELEYRLIANFNTIFPFRYKDSQVTLWHDDKIHFDRIDLLGEDENNEYVIELKRDWVSPKDILQILKYIKIYKSMANKNVIGCIASPYINKQTKLRAIKNDILIFELNNYICISGYPCDSHKLNRERSKNKPGAMPNKTIRMTDQEYIKVKEYLKTLRASK